MWNTEYLENEGTEDQCEPEVGYRKGDGKGPKPSCKSIGEELCIVSLSCFYSWYP